jgi:uncharacterized protein YegJ (DUF2314 family)
VKRFFGREQPPSVVTFPVSATVGSVFAIYFAPNAGGPTRDALAGAAATWSDAHLEPPLRDAVAAFRRQGLVSIELRPGADLPPLPIDLLRHMGLGELEERIVRATTEVVLVTGQDLNVRPRIGMWAVLTAALGVRELLQGAVFDPDALRIIDPDKSARWSSPTGEIAVTQHIIVPFSIGDRGLGWMTTRGLQKFGLPDLELRDVPPNLNQLSVLMNAVAQFLVEETFRKVAESKGKIDQLSLAAEIGVDRALVARAGGRKPDSDSAAGGAATVALRYDSTDRVPGPPMIRIERPPGFSGDTGIWLNHVASQLLGSEDKVRMTDTSGEAMTRAHGRAVAELPQIKQRFMAGLKPGEVLFIKHGFPTSTGSKEYIWATVNRWEGSALTVQVANDPTDVPGLQRGMTVMLGETDVFDWMLQLPGDRSEGGYTTKVVLDEGREGSTE